LHIRTRQRPLRGTQCGTDARRQDEAQRSDRSKINMHQDYEVKYWTKHLGVTREDLVHKVGNSAKAVEKELGF
jgi:hypothetical protein